MVRRSFPSSIFRSIFPSSSSRTSFAISLTSAALQRLREPGGLPAPSRLPPRLKASSPVIDVDCPGLVMTSDDKGENWGRSRIRVFRLEAGGGGSAVDFGTSSVIDQDSNDYSACGKVRGGLTLVPDRLERRRCLS